jgi:hypothetical protein
MVNVLNSRTIAYLITYFHPVMVHAFCITYVHHVMVNALLTSTL